MATDCVSTVDRARVLAKADEQVRRRLAELTSSTGYLSEQLTELRTRRNPVELGEARRALIDAWVDYSELAPYNLLVDPSASLGERVSPFPTDTSLVEKAVNGAFDPGSAPSFDRGFPAIEYLLYGADSTAALGRLDGDPRRVDLAIAYAAAIRQRVADTERSWLDAESAAFTSQVGTDAGSGLSRLVNSLNKHFEDMRRDELGIPFGASLGFPSPRVVQARYSGRSMLLLVRGIDASDLAFGVPGDTSSLAGYVSELSSEEGRGLARDIDQQYQTMFGTLHELLTTSLSAAVVERRDIVQTLYTAMSRQVVYLKTDLPAVTCVAITYVDNPSDSD